MTSTQLPAPHLVNRQDDLQRFVSSLLAEEQIAVDTESNSLYAYQEQVCLIQFSTSQADYLVDPLALEDLSPLAPLFSSRQVEKVFHAAEYDLMCLKRDFSFEFANLFDTMIAARILGRAAFGLGSMLGDEFGVHLNKRYQRSNWGQRPLPPNLLAYAQLDTHYLLPLRARLYQELQASDLLPLAQEDFNRVCQVDEHNVVNDPTDCWHINGSHDLDPQKAAILRELCLYRDKVARSLDKPLFKIMGDQTLLAIASECPVKMSQLKKISGMTRLQLSRHAEQILAAVQRGQQSQPIYPPPPARLNDHFLERLDTLKNWRKTTARRMGVNSDIVLPRDLLYTIARQNPQRMEDLEPLLSEVPWRMEHFGEQILKALVAC